MRVLRERDIEFTELQGGVIALLWGVYVGNPLWDAIAQGARFFTVADFIPEWAWGSMASAIGLVQLGAIVVGSWRARRWTAFALFWFWLLLAGQFGAANFRSPMILFYITFAFAAVWVHVRITLRHAHPWPLHHRGTDAATKEG